MMDGIVQRTILGPNRAEGMAMKTAHSKTNGFQEVKEAELVRVLRNGTASQSRRARTKWTRFSMRRNGIWRFETWTASPRLLRQVRAALRRVRDGSFGTCIECEWAISPKRLAAVPWASRCIQCQEAADRDGRERGSRQCGVRARLSPMPRNPMLLKTSGIRTIAFLGELLAAQMRHCHVYIRPAWAVAARHPQSRCFAVPVNDIEGLSVSGRRSLRD
jgi:RNA polymerase-binding transcription factor DksA